MALETPHKHQVRLLPASTGTDATASLSRTGARASTGCHLWGVLVAVFHQALSQQARHRLQLLLGLPDVGVQLEDLLEVAAGGQVVLPPGRGEEIKKRDISKRKGERADWTHLQTLVSQGPSVEGLLVARLQPQGGVAVLLGLSESIQLQEADGSGGRAERLNAAGGSTTWWVGAKVPVGVKGALLGLQGHALPVFLQSFLEAASLHQLVALPLQQREARLFSPGCAQKRHPSPS